jgi:ABC-type multidrug transport system permease subunit
MVSSSERAGYSLVGWWLVMVLLSGIIGLAIGMLSVAIEFNYASLIRSTNVGVYVPVAFGVCGFFYALYRVIVRTCKQTCSAARM